MFSVPIQYLLHCFTVLPFSVMLYRNTPPTLLALSGLFLTSAVILAKSPSLFKAAPAPGDGAGALDGAGDPVTTFLKSMYAPGE